MGKLKNVILNKLSKVKVKSIENIDDQIVINSRIPTLNKIVATYYIVLRNVESGRQIRLPIKDNKVVLSVEDLYLLKAKGAFNILLNFNLFGKTFYKRIKIQGDLQNFEMKNNDYTLRMYKTAKGNLNVEYQNQPLNYYLKDIKSIGKNIFVQGKVLLKTPIEISKIELVFSRRDNGSAVGYNLPIDKETDVQYSFESIIFLEKIINKFNNARWDISIQVRDKKGNKIFTDLLTVSDLFKIQNDADRYLFENRDKDDYLFVVYLTAGKNSLALWYTTKEQFSRTYRIAKGRKVYQDTIKDGQFNENMVFFESFLGNAYAGNPKYIYEFLLNHPKYKKFTYVWSCNSKQLATEIPGNPIIVQRESEEYFYYLAQSHYWVNNVLFPVHQKMDKTIYLQTWHGTPLKKLGFDITIDGPEVMGRENFYLESRNWDYLLSANKYSSDIFKRAFKYNKKMIEVGYPINDILYNDDKDELKDKFNIDKSKKIILYAPTWRDDEHSYVTANAFNLKIHLDDFYNKFKDEYVLLIKLHHLIASQLTIKEEYQNCIINMSNYSDIQELYCVSDILITDYSSVFFDYAHLKRPIIFFGYDYLKYESELRGFYLDIKKDLPGPLVTTHEELMDTIENVDGVSIKFQSKYNEFYKTYCDWGNGNSTEEVIAHVFNN
ncbi:CDP-glycerol glycerophosphotransferase family protein [Virgibacillus soli]|uniref:CDP-glycerol glycerophosphotransferase family protein n=1 Tax=Paracerasibacillus soli TaxID=480284 RepID=A0ABU5CSK5_9BACI|nr:CDP-glycerol glycerophosphotransferase family protein [Virgibacillus soli]MDY0409356.1 CDP-glycerol glycerophosphotransferase family protein [Virgibacillus soli]